MINFANKYLKHLFQMIIYQISAALSTPYFMRCVILRSPLRRTVPDGFL